MASEHVLDAQQLAPTRVHSCESEDLHRPFLGDTEGDPVNG